MREIKFRGKECDTGLWRFGSLVENTTDGFQEVYIYDKLWDTFDQDKMIPGERGIWRVFPKSVGQSTTLKDKNGKDIYEGDIVKHTYRAWMDSSTGGKGYCSNTGEVFYETKYGSFSIKRQGGGNPNFSLGVVERMFEKDMPPETNEVIGNIYENPEKLKEETT